MAYRNEFAQSPGRLVGICEGILGDQVLTDQEVYFLHDRITKNDSVAYEFPGNVIAERIREVVADGIIGGLGSPEWKHGRFGTKIEKAMQYKRDGVPLALVKEERWVGALRSRSNVGGSSDGRNV